MDSHLGIHVFYFMQIRVILAAKPSTTTNKGRYAEEHEAYHTYQHSAQTDIASRHNIDLLALGKFINGCMHACRHRMPILSEDYQ